MATSEEHRAYLEAAAPLRQIAFLDPNATEEEKAQAFNELTALNTQFTEAHPPITGTFVYTQADIDEAAAHGFK